MAFRLISHASVVSACRSRDRRLIRVRDECRVRTSPLSQESIDVAGARRLALYAAGLLKPAWNGLPRSASGAGQRARGAALQLIDHFGYLQLDTVSVAGARSHVIVLLTRFPTMDAELGEDLLRPGEPVFEYWGHEACWMPLDLYPHFQFRRDGFRKDPWWGKVLKDNRLLARDLLRRIRDEGPIRSLEMDGSGKGGWWGHKPAKRVAVMLWSMGELAILERSSFQRTFDLTERVIPERWRSAKLEPKDAIRGLLLRALDGHGWAQTGTLSNTWRLRNRREQIQNALDELQEMNAVVRCDLHRESERPIAGWIQPKHLELLDRLKRVRPDPRGRFLSPFDPLLWDRRRVAVLFGFEQVLEIFKPAPERVYGYFCLPVLSGENLVARVDLKADRKAGTVRALSRHFESRDRARRAEARNAIEQAMGVHAGSLGLAQGSRRRPNGKSRPPPIPA